jgi:DNA-binding NtrC family response regulator
VILCEGGLVTSEHLPIAIATSPRPAPQHAPTVPTATAFPAGGVSLEAIERDLIRQALSSAKNNKSQAARLLGLPRGQFYSLLRRHGLTDARR